MRTIWPPSATAPGTSFSELAMRRGEILCGCWASLFRAKSAKGRRSAKASAYSSVLIDDCGSLILRFHTETQRFAETLVIAARPYCSFTVSAAAWSHFWGPLRGNCRRLCGSLRLCAKQKSDAVASIRQHREASPGLRATSPLHAKSVAAINARSGPPRRGSCATLSPARPNPAPGNIRRWCAV